MKCLFYLASPFTHKHKKVRAERTNIAIKASILFLQHDIHVFSPIGYNGPWEKTKYKLPCEWPFWEIYDKNFLHRCDGLIVLMIDGWEKSVGMAAEIEYAKGLEFPIFYKTMEEITSGDLEDIKLFEQFINEIEN